MIYNYNKSDHFHDLISDQRKFFFFKYFLCSFTQLFTLYGGQANNVKERKIRLINNKTLQSDNNDGSI